MQFAGRRTALEMNRFISSASSLSVRVLGAVRSVCLTRWFRRFRLCVPSLLLPHILLHLPFKRLLLAFPVPSGRLPMFKRRVSVEREIKWVESSGREGKNRCGWGNVKEGEMEVESGREALAPAPARARRGVRLAVSSAPVLAGHGTGERVRSRGKGRARLEWKSTSAMTHFDAGGFLVTRSGSTATLRGQPALPDFSPTRSFDILTASPILIGSTAASALARSTPLRWTSCRLQMARLGG